MTPQAKENQKIGFKKYLEKQKQKQIKAREICKKQEEKIIKILRKEGINTDNLRIKITTKNKEIGK